MASSPIGPRRSARRAAGRVPGTDRADPPVPPAARTAPPGEVRRRRGPGLGGDYQRLARHKGGFQQTDQAPAVDRPPQPSDRLPAQLPPVQVDHHLAGESQLELAARIAAGDEGPRRQAGEAGRVDVGAGRHGARPTTAAPIVYQQFRVRMEHRQSSATRSARAGKARTRVAWRWRARRRTRQNGTVPARAPPGVAKMKFEGSQSMANRSTLMSLIVGIGLWLAATAVPVAALAGSCCSPPTPPPSCGCTPPPCCTPPTPPPQTPCCSPVTNIVVPGVNVFVAPSVNVNVNASASAVAVPSAPRRPRPSSAAAARRR